MTDKSNPIFQLQFEAEAGVRKAEPFTNITDCPACGSVDSHGIGDIEEDTFVWRECQGCGMKWRQLK